MNHAEPSITSATCAGVSYDETRPTLSLNTGRERSGVSVWARHSGLDARKSAARGCPWCGQARGDGGPGRTPECQHCEAVFEEVAAEAPDLPDTTGCREWPPMGTVSDAVAGFMAKLEWTEQAAIGLA